jgi:hypothetical protein
VRVVRKSDRNELLEFLEEVFQEEMMRVEEQSDASARAISLDGKRVEEFRGVI